MPDQPHCCMNSCRSFWILTWNRNSTWSRESHYEIEHVAKRSHSSAVWVFHRALVMWIWSEKSRNSLQMLSNYILNQKLGHHMMMEFFILSRYFSNFSAWNAKNIDFIQNKTKKDFSITIFHKLKAKKNIINLFPSYIMDNVFCIRCSFRWRKYSAEFMDQFQPNFVVIYYNRISSWPN